MPAAGGRGRETRCSHPNKLAHERPLKALPQHLLRRRHHHHLLSITTLVASTPRPPPSRPSSTITSASTTTPPRLPRPAGTLLIHPTNTPVNTIIAVPPTLSSIALSVPHKPSHRLERVDRIPYPCGRHGRIVARGIRRHWQRLHQLLGMAPRETLLLCSAAAAATTSTSDRNGIAIGWPSLVFADANAL